MDSDASQRTEPPVGGPEFWPEALDVIHSAPIALLATVEGRQPHVRPVVPAYVDLVAYVLTTTGTPKTRQISDNPRIELLHWTQDFRHLNLSGNGEVIDDAELIADVAQHFPYTVDDFFGPDLRAPALLKIVLDRVSITTFNDIIANKQPRVWRASA